jgi:hypothetical protein
MRFVGLTVWQKARVLIAFFGLCAAGVSLWTSSALAFDNDAFCAAIQPMVTKAHADAGIMVDGATRSDGIALACNMRLIDFKKFITVRPTRFRTGWEARKQAQWSEIYCQNDHWREAIESGWTVAQTMTFVDGTRHWMKAYCE